MILGTPDTKLLKKTLKIVHDWPAMFAIYSMSVLKKKGMKFIMKNKFQKIIKV
jgi:hypothetical protein